MNINSGRSAKGKVRLLVGPYYFIRFQGLDFKPIVDPPLPAKLAWTEMNTSWKKGKRK